jgi:hypothetical protein
MTDMVQNPQKTYFLTNPQKAILRDTYSKHRNSTCCINLGMFPNFLFFASFSYGFFYLLSKKLDEKKFGDSELSLFVILIPFWLLLIYCCAYVVLLGLASQNSKVNVCEKVFLSLLVPLGFIVSTVLLLCFAEGYLSNSLTFLFIPQISSFLFLYLYVRCLVKQPTQGTIFSNNAKVGVEQQTTVQETKPNVVEEKPQFY